MTFSQAIDTIEFWAACAVVERNGQRLGPIQVMALASGAFPERSARLWDQMGEKSISPEEYSLGWLKILEDLERDTFIQNVESQLKNLQEG